LRMRNNVETLVFSPTASNRVNAAQKPNSPQPMQILQWGEVSKTLLSP
jgi:hypothetical protein